MFDVAKSIYCDLCPGYGWVGWKWLRDGDGWEMDHKLYFGKARADGKRWR